MSIRIILFVILGGWLTLTGTLHHFSQESEHRLVHFYQPLIADLEEIRSYHDQQLSSSFEESPYVAINEFLETEAAQKGLNSVNDGQFPLRLNRRLSRSAALTYPLDGDGHAEMAVQFGELANALRQESTVVAQATGWDWAFWITLPLMALGAGIWIARNWKQMGTKLMELHGHIARETKLLEFHTAFANRIGSGDLDVELEGLAEEDTLGNALVRMRDNLKKVSKEDERRNWVTKGLAFFSDLLREKNQSAESLGEAFVSNLVKYMDANQGALFLLDSKTAGTEQHLIEADDQYLKLVACYAYDRRKYVDAQIEKGEGLIGQCWVEAAPIYLTDVPNDYIRIKSGLGDALPTHVAIVPLIMDNKVYGVMEIAGFSPIPDYRKDFLVKLAEGVAGTISNVKTNQLTLQLLHNSQKMTEELRAQEEEMRQNIEELRSTQEQMARKEAEMRARNNAVDNTLATAEFDMELRVISSNSIFQELMGYSSSELEGRDHAFLLFDAERKSEDYQKFRSNLKQGRSQIGEFECRNSQGETRFLQCAYSVILGRSDEPEKILMVASDLTRTQQLQRQKDEIEAIRKEEKERSDQEINSLNELMNEYMMQNQQEKSKLKKKIKELESRLTLTPSNGVSKAPAASSS